MRFKPALVPARADFVSVHPKHSAVPVGSSAVLGIGSLFTVIVIRLKHPKTLALRLREPLAAVGIIDNIGKRVVSDDVINQVIARATTL